MLNFSHINNFISLFIAVNCIQLRPSYISAWYFSNPSSVRVPLLHNFVHVLSRSHIRSISSVRRACRAVTVFLCAGGIYWDWTNQKWEQVAEPCQPMRRLNVGTLTGWTADLIQKLPIIINQNKCYFSLITSKFIYHLQFMQHIKVFIENINFKSYKRFLVLFLNAFKFYW